MPSHQMHPSHVHASLSPPQRHGLRRTLQLGQQYSPRRQGLPRVPSFCRQQSEVRLARWTVKSCSA